MIPEDRTVYVTGTFRGRYSGDPRPDSSVSAHTIYGIDIQINSYCEQTRFIDDYREKLRDADSIRLKKLEDVNLIFDLTTHPDAIHSKEHLTQVIITDYKIDSAGKADGKTYGEISGTLYGTVRNEAAIQEEKKKEAVVRTPDASVQETVASHAESDTEPASAPVFTQAGSSGSGCLSTILGLLLLLLLLSLLLRTCNSCNPLPPVPAPVIDSLKQEQKDTFEVKERTATITVNDWDLADSDRVTLKVNDIVVAENLTITKVPQAFEVTNLHEGTNVLEIIPIYFGQGDVTATVEISDGKNYFRFECDIKKGETVRKLIQVN